MDELDRDTLTEALSALGQVLQVRGLSYLLAIGPTRDELLDAARWRRSRDPSPGYRALVASVLLSLGVEDAEEALGA